MRVSVLIAVAALAVPAVASAGTVFLLDGRGWGHGVGMSQWGAEGYARHGYGYRQILAHYYPTTRLGLAPDRDVRVLLAQGQERVRIGSGSPFLVVDRRGRKVHLPGNSIVVDRRFVLRHRRLAPPLRFEPGVQPLQVSFAGYRGDVVVLAKPGGLEVVNVLPLDRYLRGVVPWEVPVGWHFATYEAQAVAARSYTLATLHRHDDFDLYSDQRSQMYGGIRAERPETNQALGATAGQVLTWRGRIIEALYFSSSGGRTSSVHDEWPRARQVPYLVSVPDPYDYISPHHVWPTRVLTPAQVGAKLHVPGVRDVRVLLNSSGRARAVRVLTSSGWRTFPAQAVRQRFDLGSTDFDINAMRLDPVAASAPFGARVKVSGFLRGLGRARLQELGPRGWWTVRPVRVDPRGTFVVRVRALRSTALRLAYNGIAGPSVPFRVAPRIVVRAAGPTLRAHVSPRLPLQVQRLTRNRWRPVATTRGVFDRRVRPGSYRVAVLGAPAYVAEISAPVAVHAAA